MPLEHVARTDAALASLRSDRNLRLDFLKGLLVVVMALYHAMNILSNAGPEAYAYLRFVSGAFILLTGFTIAVFYGARFSVNPVPAARRLIVRGLKLLALFTLLNMLIQLSGFGNPSKGPTGIDRFLSSLADIYLVGTPYSSSFQILLPIAYLLILSPLALYLAPFAQWMLVAAIACAFAQPFLGAGSGNYEFLVLGNMGLAGGMLVGSRGDSMALPKGWIAAVGLAAVIALMPYASGHPMAYAIATASILALVYALTASLDLHGKTGEAFVLMGQYSLVCYISQIVFLQVVNRVLAWPKLPLGWELLIVAMATVCVMLAIAATLRLLQLRSGVIDRTYKLIFA